MKQTTFGYTTILLVLFACGIPCGLCQESGDLETQRLQERALQAQEKYPWLIQLDRGLSVLALNIPREEFLRGVNAATDLVFEGTGELPEQITITGFFPNVGEVLKNLSSLDPALRQEISLKEKRGRFFHLEDTTSGLSDEDLVRKYRRQKLGEAGTSSNTGAYLAGGLVVDGVLVPPPVQVEVIPNAELGEVQVLANQNVIERLKYTDPYLLDQELFQAETPEKFRHAVESKADRIWHQVNQIPFSGTREQLMMTVSQLSAIYGIAVAKVEGGSIRIETMNGKKFSWSPNRNKTEIPMTEPEAYQKAYDMQSQIFSGLGTGGVVFCSIQFGFHVVPDGYYFTNDLRQIASEEGSTSGDRARKIRQRWPEHADWVLEYYYTSLMDEIGEAPPNPLLNSPLVFPLPTPVIPNKPESQEAPKTPEEILKELLEK